MNQTPMGQDGERCPSIHTRSADGGGARLSRVSCAEAAEIPALGMTAGYDCCAALPLAAAGNDSQVRIQG